MVESSTSTSLLTSASLRGMCDFVDRLNIAFACPGVSVASRLAELRGKNCSQLDDDDAAYAWTLLDRCAPSYTSGKLKPPVRPEDRANLSESCFRADFVYNVMHYFADVGFDAKSHDLKYTIVYINYRDNRVTADTDKRFYQDHVEGKTMDNGIVRLVTVGFSDHYSVKNEMFNAYLIGDLKYFGLAVFLIALFSLMYLRSFVLVIGTFTNVLLSFGFAYFLYYYVCQMVFFPFINLVASLLLIAIGADDVFVFHDAWLQVKADHPTCSADQRMSKTFSHAIVSISVTSFTTAAAFLANAVSNITAIQCFGIFAALAIVANLAMMVTIMPAIVLASDACSARVTCPWSASTFGAFYRIPNAAYSWVTARVRSFFHTAIPAVLRRVWWLCIAVGLVLGVSALLIDFYKPALKPPTTKEVQLFNKDNILEKWDLDFKHRFPVEIEAANKPRNISVVILFGFKATDPGNRLNPDDKTKALSRDGAFDMKRSETQEWLRKMCNATTESAFADSRFSGLPCLVSTNDVTTLLIESECEIVKTPGVPKENTTFEDLCCVNNRDPKNLYYCLETSVGYRPVDSTEDSIRGKSTGSPVYDNIPASSSVIGYRLHVQTNLSFSGSYEDMRVNYGVLSSFMKTQLESAPEGLRSGFLADNDFAFYDLQQSLATGTFKSVGLSIAVSFVVLLLTVRNVLVACYAILTITMSIACTVASIVLMGWKLNIVESLTITLAVGMSIDFTIHYGVGYQLTTDAVSAARTRESARRVGPAVAAAAWTTFSAGVAVLNCSVEAYRKLGVFLALVMVVSWVYAAFFFLSLCHVVGPVGGFCQIPCPTLRLWPRKHKATVMSVYRGDVASH